jgi:glycosyltransferase involved in cell wall biosynthesis
MTSTVIGTVAMLRPDKNHARMLRAFSTASSGQDAWLVLVGAGECRSDLEALAQSRSAAPTRVVFTGPSPDPAACYQAFDAFALSSDTEQMPLSVLEAMATGLRVMSTDVGDVRDMLGDEAAGVIAPLDAVTTMSTSCERCSRIRSCAGQGRGATAAALSSSSART